jgi:hypothetical protein
MAGGSRSRKKWPDTRKQKPTGLYDRRNDDISVGEVEKIGIYVRQLWTQS